MQATQFTHEQLQKAFAKVANYRDWKAPVSRLVFKKDIEVTLRAIEFFTATEGKVEWETTDDDGNEIAAITAPGYRNGPAGDR
jgi:hypothetical protein